MRWANLPDSKPNLLLFALDLAPGGTHQREVGMSGPREHALTASHVNVP